MEISLRLVRLALNGRLPRLNPVLGYIGMVG